MIKNCPKVNHSQEMPNNPEEETSRSKILRIQEKPKTVINSLYQSKEGVHKTKLGVNLDQTCDLRNQGTLLLNW